MKKLLIILLALVLAAFSGFFVSGVLAPLTVPRLPTNDMPSGAEQSQGDITPEELMQAITESASTSSTASQSSSSRAPGIYARYAEGVAGRGRNILLFFHDPASSASTDIDSLLRSTYGAGSATIDTYRIDTPSMQALLSLYGITTAPAFVELGPNGEILSTIISPQTQAIPALLSPQ